MDRDVTDAIARIASWTETGVRKPEDIAILALELLRMEIRQLREDLGIALGQLIEATALRPTG